MKIKTMMLCRNFELKERIIRAEDKDFDFANGTYLINDSAIKKLGSNPRHPVLIYHQGNALPRGIESSIMYYVLNVWWPATLRGMSNRSLGRFKFGEFISKLLDPRVWPLYFIAFGLLYHFLR